VRHDTVDFVAGGIEILDGPEGRLSGAKLWRFDLEIVPAQSRKSSLIEVLDRVRSSTVFMITAQ